jgi:hypothetical protein
VCDPSTVKAPLEPSTVPLVVVPSPQSINAAKSAATLPVNVSVKVATCTLLNGWPAVPLILSAVSDSASASLTVATPVTVAVALSAVRVSVVVTVSWPSSPKVWGPPVTVNAPFPPDTDPLVVVPSPQSMVALKEAAVSLALLSVKVATCVPA